MNINKKDIYTQQNTAVFLATILIFSTIVISSCKDASKNALDMIPEAFVAPTPYLATWYASKIFGKEPGEPCNVAITQVNNNLRATIIETGLEGELLLTQVNDDVIASLKNPNSSLWYILKIVLEDDGNTMNVYNLNLSELKTAFESNSLTGYNVDFEGQFSPRITTEGAEIRNYIKNNPNSFDSIPCLIFQKSI